MSIYGSVCKKRVESAICTYKFLMNTDDIGIKPRRICCLTIDIIDNHTGYVRFLETEPHEFKSSAKICSLAISLVSSMATSNSSTCGSGSPSHVDREEIKQIQLALNQISSSLLRCKTQIDKLNKEKKSLQQRLDKIVIAAAITDGMPGTICQDGLRQTKINRFSQTITDEKGDPVYLIGKKKRKTRISNKKTNIMDLTSESD